MSNTKYTPGPWHIENGANINGRLQLYITDKMNTGSTLNGKLIAEVRDRDSEIASANARLIAMAPEMLDALKSLRVSILSFGNEFNFDSELEEICAAIAKAEGNSDE